MNECLQCPLAECDEKDPRCLIRPKRKQNVNYFRRIVKATDEEIIALYQSGLNSRLVAERKGISQSCVRSVLDYNNVEKREPRKPKIKRPRGRPRVFMYKDRVRADRSGGRPRKRDERFLLFLVGAVVNKSQNIVV